MARFTDKIAVVTGASKGIGAGIAKRLAAEGASVVVNYASSSDGANRIVDDIVQAGGKATAIGASVSNEDDVARLFEEVRKAFGHVDVLVNNAGVYDPKPIESLSLSEFNRHFDTNVLGLLLATKAALPLFPATGGSIVNISSVVSTMAPAAAAIYVGTKGAVDSITKSLAKEFAPRKIRVNGVRPGFVVTEGTHSAGMAGGEFETWAVANTPLGRAGQPEDIAASVAFLASDDASWITGESLLVAGGSAMQQADNLSIFLTHQVLAPTPISAITTAGIVVSKAGSASGLQNMLRNLGGTVGTATLATTRAKREQFYANIIGQPVTLSRDEVRQRLAV